MPFTPEQLSSMANAALDFYLKGKPLAQTVQGKPMLSAMRARQKSFSGGAGLIRRNVKGEYVTSMTGYTGDDQVTFNNPAKIRQIYFPWYEAHAGIETTLTELKRDGISVTDSLTGAGTSQHSGAEMHRISGIWEDKLDDMREGVERSMNEIFWGDGTLDPKLPPGIRAFVVDSPTTGVIAGLDRASTTWWRNRATLGITPSAANQTLTKTLRAEVRQLQRYGGKPQTAVCGSAFIEALEDEVSEKGVYTQQGFARTTDISMGDIAMRGVGVWKYDPTLDDLGLENYGYLLDLSKLYPMVMEGEDMKKHVPARPHDRFVIYQGVTWTGAVVVEQMNCHGVYSIA